MKRRTLKAVLLFSGFFLAAGFSVAALLEDQAPQAASPLELAAYLSTNDAVWIRPGLNVSILDVSIGADRKPVVTFKLTDGSGQPLDRDGNLTPGTVSTSFILAYLPQNSTQYWDYSVRPSTANGRTEQQAGTDSGGKYLSLGSDGRYTYTFGTVLPSGYDTAATHTLGIYATRNLQSLGLSLYVSNVTKNFVPNGSPVTKVRDVVATVNCNACHDPLAAHGTTGRQNVEVCILCHTPQTINAQTGNTVDMKVMVHKIHMGSSLPSVIAGKPYQIITTHGTSDFSTVAFPMDIRNCTACHKGTTQPLNHLLNPTRDACGSCHDDINWTTGQNHVAGAQKDDKQCAVCHQPDGQGEYNAAVKDAHVPEYKSQQLVNPVLTILSVTNTAPGQKPVVQFQIKDKNKNVMDPNKMGRLSFTLAGPTSDYRWYVTENPLGKATVANSVATYTFTNAVPSDAKGTYVIEAESYVSTVIQKLSTTTTVRDASDNVVKPFAVTGTVVTPRRAAVATANCVKCHDKLQLHGSNRNQVEACAVCHNPTNTDKGQRPATAGVPEAIDFKVLIHKIHTGEELNGEYTVYGNGGSKHTYNEVRYPGDRRDCLQCHVAGAFTLPIAATATPVTTPRSYWDPTMPTAAACLGCHDSLDAAGHAMINTVVIPGIGQVESCSVCHQEIADFAVSKAHAR